MGGPPFVTNGGGTLSMSAPVAIKPSTAATGMVPDGSTWSAKITFVYTGVNATSTDPYDPTYVQLAATAEGKACSQVFEGNRYRAPTVKLQPGQNVSWDFAFSCPVQGRGTTAGCRDALRQSECIFVRRHDPQLAGSHRIHCLPLLPLEGEGLANTHPRVGENGQLCSVEGGADSSLVA